MSDLVTSAREATAGREIYAREPVGSCESSDSAVSWAAVIAGAVAASALSLALLMLGAGIGLGSFSPWSNNNPSVTTFGILAAAWFIAVQLFASGVGGYLAGRLRTRWVNVHTDEVYFRDTAHGLLVWAVGAIISASLSTSGVVAVATDAAHIAASAVQAAGTAARRIRLRVRQPPKRLPTRAVRAHISPICCSAPITPIRQAMAPHRARRWAAFWPPTPCRAICRRATRPISLRLLRLGLGSLKRTRKNGSQTSSRRRKAQGRGNRRRQDRRPTRARPASMSRYGHSSRS